MNSINIQPHTEPVIQRRTISEWQKILRTWRHQYHLTILKIVHHDTTTEDECTIYLLREERTQAAKSPDINSGKEISNDSPGDQGIQGFVGDRPF